MLFKNQAQKIHVYAYDYTTGAAKTGDAANITAYVSLDGTANAVDDTNPAEVDATNMPGVYVFDITAAETNCDSFSMSAKSTTSNIRLDPIIGFTTPVSVPQTGDAYARIGSPAGASLVADLGTATTATQNLVLAVKAVTDDIPFSVDGDIKATLDGESATLTSPAQAALALATRQEIDSNSTKLTNAVPTISAISTQVWTDKPTIGTSTLTTSDVQTAMTSQGYTSTRAGYLDVLNGILAAIWGYATRTLSAFSFKPAVTLDWSADVSNKPTIGTGTSTLTTSDIDTRLAAFVPATGFYANQPAASVELAPEDIAAIAAGIVVPEPDLTSIEAVTAAIKAKTDLITSGSFSVTTPLSASGSVLSLNIGDDYDDAHNTEIDFTSADFPDLTVSGTVLSLIINISGVKLTITGAALSATAARFEITKTDTLTLPAGRGTYSLRVKFADLDEITLLKGIAIAKAVL